jgi:hypothetical protein
VGVRAGAGLEVVQPALFIQGCMSTHLSKAQPSTCTAQHVPGNTARLDDRRSCGAAEVVVSEWRYPNP